MHGTRQSNADKHPGHIVKPPRAPQRTHAQVEAEKLEKKEAAVAAAAEKRASLRFVAGMEVKQREVEETEQSNAARPVSSSQRKVVAPREGEGDAGWENLHAGMKRGGAKKAATSGKAKATAGKGKVTASKSKGEKKAEASLGADDEDMPMDAGQGQSGGGQDWEGVEGPPLVQ
jgi:hypothetical protein